MGLRVSNVSSLAAIAAIGLSLAAVAGVKEAAAEQWCISVGGGTNICHPTLAECEKAHPGRACVRGAS